MVPRKGEDRGALWAGESPQCFAYRGRRPGRRDSPCAVGTLSATLPGLPSPRVASRPAGCSRRAPSTRACAGVRRRSDHRSRYLGRGGRSVPLHSPSAVSQILRARSSQEPVRRLALARATVRSRQPTTAARPVNGSNQRRTHARELVPRRV
jgi:hypothetical protein